MGNENLEQLKNEGSPQSISEKLEITNKTLLKKIYNLENDLVDVEDDLKNEQGLVKSLEKELKSSQDCLLKIQDIVDKLKISSPGFYNILVADKKYIEQILYETIIPDKPKK